VPVRWSTDAGSPVDRRFPDLGLLLGAALGISGAFLAGRDLSAPIPSVFPIVPADHQISTGPGSQGHWDHVNGVVGVVENSDRQQQVDQGGVVGGSQGALLDDRQSVAGKEQIDQKNKR
jgi:hypothetical protein